MKHWCFELYWSDDKYDAVFLVPESVSIDDIKNIISDVQKSDENYNVDDFVEELNKRCIPYEVMDVKEIYF
jgi:hypothetical protein